MREKFRRFDEEPSVPGAPSCPYGEHYLEHVLTDSPVVGSEEEYVNGEKPMWTFDCAQRAEKREDRVVMEPLGRHAHVCAVFDGHGNDSVAQHCAERLPTLMHKTYVQNAARRLTTAFTVLAKETDAMHFAGSTATIAVLWNSGFIAVGTLGDSLWVAKNRRTGTLTLGPAHNIGSNTAEREAALKRGGQKFFYDGRGYLCTGHHGLQLTRVLGDAHMLPAVSREPEIRIGRLVRSSGWFALMSDGVLDTLSENYPKDVVDFEQMMDDKCPAQEIVKAFYPRKWDDTSLIACHWVAKP